MKRIMNVYESCKTSIRITYVGFILIAIGFFIQNKNVNLFYTFKSAPILFIAELFLDVGRLIIMNLPLIFMLNIACKKVNSSSPVILSLVGYFTFLITTMLFSNQTLGSSAYASGYGINSAFNLTIGTRLPLETGLIGSLLVAYATRLAFVFSRNRSSTSLLSFFNKDTAGVIYNVLFCFAIGIVVAYGYPYLYKFIQSAITFISEDLMDPLRIGIYGFLDRVLSILGLSNIIRNPFWYTNAGGSFVNTLTGQSVFGDVNIWTVIKNSASTYMGAGRFITPYYIINMFMIPGFYIGTVLSMSDRYERNHFTIVFLLACFLSFVMGNPLPAEMLMLFTSPFILITYLGLVAVLFAILVKFGVFLGYETAVTNTAVAMPGSFPDFIINIRNIRLADTLGMIAIIGLIFLIIMIVVVLIYYRFIAYDLVHTGKSNKLINSIIDGVGGKNNIDYVGSGLFRLNIYLKSLEEVNVEQIQNIGAKRITETRSGITIEFGTSSYIIAKRIRKKIIKKESKTKKIN